MKKTKHSLGWYTIKNLTNQNKKLKIVIVILLLLLSILGVLFGFSGGK